MTGVATGGSPVRILIVDDDPLMTDMLPRKVRAVLGVHVLTASTPEEGLDVASRQEGHGLVVLSDYNLRAAMTGLDLLDEIQRRLPGAVRILFSGHTAHEIGPRLEEARLDGFIEKPMRLDEMIPPLLRILREAGVASADAGGAGAGG